MEMVTPYIFYIKPPSWIEGKIESIGVQYRSGSTDKSVLEQTIKFIFVEYFIHTCLTLLKVQSFPIFYQLFYKQRPVKFSITVHITDTGTFKQTIFFSQIFHNQVKIYRWVFNSLPANGDYCRLLINFANGLVPDQA